MRKIFTSAAALLLILISNSAFSTEFAAGFQCAEDAGGVGSCTANEISIANVTNIVIDGNPTECNEGDPVLITSVDVEFDLNTGERYDPLFWVGEQANDPRATGGTCFVSSIPTPADSIFQHLEGGSDDSCLDVNNPAGTPQTKTFTNISIECRDADGDNVADMQAIVSWHQNVNFACGTGDGETFAPGAPSKCDYSIIPLGIEFEQESFLTVIKDVQNNWGGEAIPNDFDLLLTGVDGTHDGGVNYKSGNNPSIETGVEYTLSEPTQPAGYSLSGIDCRDDSDDSVVGTGGVFTAADNQAITCTVTNSDIAPTITLLKSLPNDDGGTAVADDFQASIDGGIGDVDWGAATQIPVGDYQASETSLPGYQASPWGIDCGDDGSFSIALDEDLTCNITNDDIAPTLTLSKVVINNDGGGASEDDFQAYIDGGPVDWGVANAISAGAHTASEDQGIGYTNEGWTLDCDSDGNIVMALDTDYFCEITNDDIPSDPVPGLNTWAAILMVLALLATGWYFRPRRLNPS